MVSVTYRISVFGPVIFFDGIALKLEGPQSSHVLAVLAIRLGTPVQRADLVNEVSTSLFSERAPESAGQPTPSGQSTKGTCSKSRFRPTTSCGVHASCVVTESASGRT